VKSDRSTFVGSGTNTSSGARSVETDVVVGSADSRVIEATFVIVVIVALG
jgi:hypothetical protein